MASKTENSLEWVACALHENRILGPNRAEQPLWVLIPAPTATPPHLADNHVGDI